MTELKTKENNKNVVTFINELDDETKKSDSKKLLKIFEETTGYKPKMWGASIIGYGSYHYKSERSSQEGDWPLTGFSPRKANISIYIMPGFKKYEKLLTKLGKHKTSTGSCLYIKKLDDIDEAILKKIIDQSVKDMKNKYHQ
ncbi:DUF1801 domain-containing protein [Candidatus Peregrinibacteria bacterium]|nr:DUF1801 domain-containing protein [Candidatus Peregrinibacteria bacterium]